MASTQNSATLRLPSFVDRAKSSAVPLAWRNFVSNGPRLIRSLAGISFATLLMMTELGFYDAFIGSNLLPIRDLDGDIMLVSSTKYEFARSAPFPRRQFHEARAVPGVASVRPVYIKRYAIWKNPQNQKIFDVQVFAFDPDQPVFLLPEINAQLDALRQPDSVIVDRRARSHIGTARAGTETELAYRRIRVVGTFSLGPSFFAHGTVVMSDWNFLKLFGGSTSSLEGIPDLNVGVVKLLPGQDVSAVQQALQGVLPPNVIALTKSELIDKEAKYLAQYMAVGPVFGIATLVGFAVGMLISYQILFSELTDQLPQYATLTAMGYRSGYLCKVVLQQGLLYAALGYAPAWMLCQLIFKLIGDVALIPMRVTAGLTAASLALTVAMCIGAALLAVRRVITADPAELLR